VRKALTRPCAHKCAWQRALRGGKADVLIKGFTSAFEAQWTCSVSEYLGRLSQACRRSLGFAAVDTPTTPSKSNNLRAKWPIVALGPS
jgi:hypothetical protein